MPVEIKMPALSPTMEKGTLARWLVKPGDTIRSGDPIAEVETDKATMEVEAVDEGRIAELLVAAGSENVEVGTVIALIGTVGEGVAAPQVDAVPQPELEKAEAAFAGPSEASPLAALRAPPPVRTRIAPSDRIKVSPLALRIAEAKGIALDGIKGSGPYGRIVRSDLGFALPAAPAAATPAVTVPTVAPAIAPPPVGVPVVSEKLSTMRKTIARRLTESKQRVPHFYLTARCNLDALLQLRGELNAGLAGRGIKLSVNDMLIKALACALIEVPDANVQFGGEMLHRFDRVDVSMAVAIDGGLITPVVKDVGAMSLSAIATRSKELVESARAGRLTPADYEGGTVSISNLGMFGIDEMFPVINPPQALILGTAAGILQPWHVDGKVGLATIMAATASFDHRAIDGAVAARFMSALRAQIETPLQLVA